MTLPLAIYTAWHGLAWRGATRAVPYAELDACRRLLGAIPDFEAGESGYEGVAAVGGRVFAIRCFSAAKWDFRGRDSLYLAVTWLPRDQVEAVNFGALLAAPELSVPLRNPPETFAWLSPSCALDAFAEMRRLLTAEPPDARIRLVRSRATGGTVRRLEEPHAASVAPKDGGAAGVAHRIAEVDTVSRGASLRRWGVRNATRVGVALAVTLTLGLLALVAVDYFRTNPFKTNTTQTNEQEETKNDRSREVAEESDGRNAGDGRLADAANAGRAVSARE